jgi:hypothetical protein
MYPQEMVNPMQAELTAAGFQDLHSAEAVENAMKLEGTTLVVVNSVCGCAARNARPGAKMSLEGAKKPDHLITVLQELIKMPLMLQDNTCSLFLHHHQLWLCSKNGELVHMLERHHIEVAQLS